MFHAFDSTEPNRATTRPQWMALLARAPLPLLEQAVLPHQSQRRSVWLRRPETGLYMVQGRAGGSGERFNLGEITVTRCALRSVDTRVEEAEAPVGVAYVTGRHHRRAELAALADALLQDAALNEALEQSLLAPIRQHLALEQARHQAQVQATRVDFFTVAREAGNAADEEDGA